MKIKSLLITAVLATAILFSGTGVNAEEVDIQALIAQLEAQIAQLMAQIQALQAQQGQTPAWCHTFNANIRYGDTGSEVEALWTALGKEFPGDITHLSYDREGMGQPNRFGDYTASAVVEFQEKYASEILASYGLKHGTGYVGTTTRAKLNALYGCNRPISPPVLPPDRPISPPVFPPDQPSITVISPNGGETFILGQTMNITWNTIGYDSNAEVAIALEKTPELSTISPTLSRFTFVQNTGSYSWTIPSAFNVFPLRSTLDRHKIKIFIKKAGTLNWEIVGSSDSYFSIVAPSTQRSITVTSPNGGEAWVKGNTYDITWKSSGVENVHIDVLESDSNAYTLISNIPASIGKYSWTIGSKWSDISVGNGNVYKIRVLPYPFGDDTWSIYDKSDNYFSITAPGTAACTDSDGGRTYYTKGQTTGTGNWREATYGTYSDFCNGRTLTEYWCSNNLVAIVNTDCPYGCENGACKPSSTSLNAQDNQLASISDAIARIIQGIQELLNK